MTKDEVLEQCTIEGNVVKLPDTQLERKLYMEVKKSLEGIGGKWKGGKVAGFVFPSDPAALLGRVQEGEKINLKKDFQFFATPEGLARDLVIHAALKPSVTVLEPSAGQGAIMKEIRRLFPRIELYCFELMDENVKILRSIKDEIGKFFISNVRDFLEYKGEMRWDRIVANPPFTKNQDIDHVRKMHSLLNDNGRMVSVMSNHWRISNNHKEVEFRQWFEAEVDSGRAQLYEVEADTFKESGTKIAACYVVMDKDDPDLH